MKNYFKHSTKAIALAAVLCSYAPTTGYAQQRVCGTMQYEQWLQQQNPKRAEQRQEFEQAVQRFIERQKTLKTENNNSTQAIIKIPLVVHVVFHNASDSVSDAQIFSQINILNNDYTRKNADTLNTPTAFKSVAGAPMIQYCWAQQDPSGNPTNGIERRKNTAITSWAADNKIKSYATGGLNAWDPSRYFNIWVCNLGGGLLGYGEFPSSTLSNTYGFVAGATCFGNMGLAQAPYNKGRTATHEIGHCFNLYHIWGDDNGACTGTDYCNDTPNQAGENYGCPSYPHTDACSPSAPGVMFMNYMDYTDDGCMNIFTKDQSTRMLAIINTPPYNSLTTSTACNAVALAANDAGISSILAPAGTSCATNIIPKVVLKNWGTNTISSCTIKYKVDNNAVQSFAWTGNLASLASTTVTLASTGVSNGNHVFTAYTSLPNGSSDPNHGNDTARANFSIITTGSTLPLFEGFEGASFPPSGWAINNPDGLDTWKRATNAHKTGTACAVMDNYTNSHVKEIDDIVTPGLSFSGVSSPQLSFQVAYKLYSNPGLNPSYSDTLQVLISTDCGATYTSLYKKYGNNLSSTSPTWANSAFTPTSTQWRLETIPLSSYAGVPNVFIKFRNISDYENFLYLDDINILDASTTNINLNTVSNGVSIYPNPSANGNFSIDIKQSETSIQKITAYDLVGKKVFELNEHIPSGIYNMNLSHLSSGTYFIQIVKEDKTLFDKIIISK
ncbi:MAG: choice-of-anchor J domain-containing protein [Bacteroidetes bacterium]|nr:choice-of-anchor J domain-containing protein [Bacteroidota bacterium]